MVRPETPGVPTGGRYGNVRRFRQLVKRYGWKLAWSWLWDCFILYNERTSGQINDYMHFLHGITQKPIPLTDEWVQICNYLRDQSGGGNLAERLNQIGAKRAYAEACERRERADARRPEVMSKTALDLGERTARTTVRLTDRTG